MNLDSFTGPGSTPSRRRFWDKVCIALAASQKIAGDNVTVAEHQGAGSIISVTGKGQRGGGGGGVGACCYNDGTCDDLTESDCTDAGGNWQGFGTACDDDPNPCVGACCEGESGMTCVDDSTPDSCTADGGTFQDFGTTCADPDIDCVRPVCCEGAFDAFDGSGRKFLTKTTTNSGSANYTVHLDDTWNFTSVDRFDGDCDEAVSCFGSSDTTYEVGFGNPCPEECDCNCTYGDDCNWTCDPPSSECCGITLSCPHFGGIGVGCSSSTMTTATSQITTITCTAPQGTSTETVDIELSDECTPI